MSAKQKILSAIVVLFLTGSAFLFGVNAGYGGRSFAGRIPGIAQKERALTVETDFSPFWKAWDILNQKYLFPAETGDQ